MHLLATIVQRLNVIETFRELGTSKVRRETLFALASTQLLVQFSSLPVALTIPSVARHFDVEVSQAAWMVIIRLLMLGSTVFLAARLGEKHGHVRVFFIGTIIMTVASGLSSTAQSLNQLIMWSALVGIGGGLITANSNAILVLVFDSSERGRAFAVPNVAARFGTLIGLVLFGLFLQYFSWRLVFFASLPLGLLVIKNTFPLLKHQIAEAVPQGQGISISYISAGLMVITLGTFILSGLHIHGGAESFTSPEGLGYHLPMQVLFLSLLALFVIVQLRSKEPYLDFRYFRQKYFSMALFSNTTYHLSMLAVTTLIPIMVENGLGQAPIVVTMVLLPGRVLGLFLPVLAGWLYDHSNPRWLRPGSMMLIAVGFLLVGFFSAQVPIWGLPLLLTPLFFGSNMFGTANNALVMNTLPDNRTFASGMLETTRQMGHTLGATIGATVLGLALPLTIDLLPAVEAQSLYRQGFQYSALAVVWIMAMGSIVAMFQRMPAGMGRRQTGGQPAPQAGGDG